MEPIERELKKIEKAENRMRLRAEKNANHAWKSMLEERVPKKVMSGLQNAYSKAFYLIFEKGAGMIEKTYNRDALEKEFLIRDYALELTGSKKELRRLKRDATRKQAAVTLGSAVEGIGLGALGIGIPDIVIWLAVLLRSIYETALAHGYGYESMEEKLFILKMMEASMQSGELWAFANADVDAFLCQDTHAALTKKELAEQIEKTASAFAADMLAMKFIQGVPIVGIIGGASNPVYYRKVMRYVQLKYSKRYLLSRSRLSAYRT